MKLITVKDAWTEKSSKALKIGKYTVKLWVVLLIMTATVGTVAAVSTIYQTETRVVDVVTSTNYTMTLEAGPYNIPDGGSIDVSVTINNTTGSPKALEIGSNIWSVTSSKLNVYLCDSSHNGLPDMTETVPASGSFTGFLRIEDVSALASEGPWNIEFYLQDPEL